MQIRDATLNELSRKSAGFTLKHWVVLCGIVVGAVVVIGATRSWHFSTWRGTANADQLDSRLQAAAAAALGDRRGTIIVMDAQTGRIRAVVNPEIAFQESFPAGSTVKPFTMLAAFRSGVLNADSRASCGDDFYHDQFHTRCTHPRSLTPLNPTEAIAYSCNYFFGKVGERLEEATFIATLNNFGFGKKTGAQVGEASGKLLRNHWKAENAIGETDTFLTTPIQLLNAYTALVNGGRLFEPRIASSIGFTPKIQNKIQINDEQRVLILDGMRGAVRYGTAESAHLYSLPNFVLGKTGTATQVNGFRPQGWFVGLAYDVPEGEGGPTYSPEGARLAVLVFLPKANGSEAAQLARPIFGAFSREPEKPGSPSTQTTTRTSSTAPSADPSQVRVHIFKERVTRTMRLEDYVERVVAAEGSTENELEALKALAIASRTYTIKNLNRHAREGFDLCTSTHCQRFNSTTLEAAISPSIKEAVGSTAGLVLRDSNNEIADSYFSASCGGATSNIHALWGASAPPYLRGGEDEYCESEPNNWTDEISNAGLLKALQTDPRTNVGAHLGDVKVLRRDRSGRAELMSIKGERSLTVKGWDFKIIVGRELGWNLLKSSRFDVSRSGSSYVFRGTGFGHGLGLCQKGAHVMANRGAAYRQILSKYFPGTSVSDAQALRSPDLIWLSPSLTSNPPSFAGKSRLTLSSEHFRVSYPASVDKKEISLVLSFLQASRRSLTARVAAAGFAAELPDMEVFINETTGDFVGRTGLPPWAAAATKGNRIETQPIETLRKRRILETTLRHELVHTLVDVLGRGRTPRWLAEGLAIHLAGEGSLVRRYDCGQKWTTQEIETRLNTTQSAADMRAAYAAAYGEVKRLIAVEGEANVWRRIAK